MHSGSVPSSSALLEVVDEANDLPGHAGFARPREDAGDAVGMGFKAHVSHGVDGEDDVEPELVCESCGLLHCGGGGDAGDNNLRDTELLQVLFEVGVRERSPRPLRHHVVLRLPPQLGHEIGPTRRKLPTVASLFRSARRSSGNVYEHDRQGVSAECVGEGARLSYNLGDRVRSGIGDDALLQIDNDERGLRIYGAYCHGVLMR